MITLLQCEFKKTRRRYIFLTALIITALELFWAFYGNYDADSLKNGWMLLLYQFPLTNAIFLPLLSIVVSSRLSDTEHKGEMFKQLCCITKKGKLYDAKFLYGFSMVLLCIMISWGVTMIFGMAKGFAGAVPLRLYLLYLLFTIVPTIAIYIFQYTLSIIFKNQAITFFAGIIGEFCGIFSMFISQIPFLRKALIWGHYGVLQFVGMYGWNKDTRMKNVYFEVYNIDWLFFGIMIVVSIVMYMVGRKLFCEREV